MQIILLEKIHKLGDLGDNVEVANGYARNFLIPQKKAVRATEAAMAAVEQRRRELAAQESKRREVAQARANLLARTVRLERRAGEGGKLYGSVTPADLAEALSADGAHLEKSEVLMPDGPLKELGAFDIEIMLHAEVRFSVQVEVAAEDGGDAHDSGDFADSADSEDSRDSHDSGETHATPDSPPDPPETPAE